MSRPAIFLDLDNTLFRGAFYYEWAVAMLSAFNNTRNQLREVKEAKKLLEDGMISESKFVSTVIERTYYKNAFAGFPIRTYQEVCQAVGKCCRERLNIFPRELLSACKNQGFFTAVLTGSPHDAVVELLKPYEIDYICGVRFLCDDRRLSGAIDETGVQRKEHLVRQLEANHRLSLESSIAIGDMKTTDEGMLSLVGYPIVYDPDFQLLMSARRNQWLVVREHRGYVSFCIPDGDVSIRTPLVELDWRHTSLHRAFPWLESMFLAMQRNDQLAY